MCICKKYFLELTSLPSSLFSLFFYYFLMAITVKTVRCNSSLFSLLLSHSNLHGIRANKVSPPLPLKYPPSVDPLAESRSTKTVHVSHTCHHPFFAPPTRRLVRTQLTFSGHCSTPWVFPKGGHLSWPQWCCQPIVSIHLVFFLDSLFDIESIKPLFSSLPSSLAIITVKLQGSSNYVSRVASVELWFMGQGFRTTWK